ncbi:phosphorothioated DNA-binding restriction endonuclease [Actinomadura sp. WMMB 499]|uniref:phosphorothioated DNA-binding restriction endonuclease n=1 Tax=Actinomadura sp. WMMB 499 TaxID=1219491 RepID=UPI001244B077|nr:HNH endonuclease [Actinomadura sp. WMMB 499]QFG24390.1 restriction endonuclease [Actinomadura sp. WMMB 499]
MDWVERVTTVNQWRRGGKRAPHKPLLLLYALGHFQNHGDAPIVYRDAEDRLRHLLDEFWRKGSSPAYPFHHLTSDGLWEVRTDDGGGSPGPNVGPLRRANAAGRFADDLVRDLRGDPGLAARLGRAVLDANFEPSLHAELCAEVGLAVDGARRRDREFRRLVLIAYEYRCAFCGFDGTLDGTAVGLDAAHVQWWAFGGPDEVSNGVCLCVLHHKLFDKGVLGMAGDTITVSTEFVGRGEAARTQVTGLAGRPVIPPQGAFPAVAAERVAWHGREVFRGGPRAA